MRFSHDNHTGSGWSLPVFSWRNWYTLGAEPWITLCQVTQRVVASRCLLISLYGATSTLGPHDFGYILGLRLQMYWVAMDMLVEDGMGVEILARWSFGICLASLPALGDYSVIHLLPIGYLTHLLLFCNVFNGLSCNWRPSHILLFSWKGICCEYLQIWKSLLFLVSLSLVCFDFNELVWLSHVGNWLEFGVLVRFDFSNFVWLVRVGDRLEFAVLVLFFGLSRRGLDLICCACFICSFFFDLLRAFSFLVGFEFILFVRTWVLLEHFFDARAVDSA